MPKGNCGAVGDIFPVLDQLEDEEQAHLLLTWVSEGGTWPNCLGHFDQLVLTNHHDDPWEAVFDRTGNGAITGDEVVTFPMDPNSEQTMDTVLLAARGIVALADIGGTMLRPQQPAE